MNKKKWIVTSVIAVITIIAILFISGYNSFVGLDETVQKQWNEMQNAYQRRSDLVPSLVNVIKGSTEYERTVMQQLTEARAKVGAVNVSIATYDNYQKQQQVQTDLTNNMNRLIAIVQRYPDLQSTNQFKTLQTQLEGTERRIKFARKDFNEAVAAYNQKVRSFPWNMVGKVLGFQPKEGFKADMGTENVPEVTFK